MRKTLKKLTALLMAVFMLFGTTACRSREMTLEDGKFYVYFRSQNRRELYPVEGVVDLTLPMDTLISSVYSHMVSGADESDYTSAVSSDAVLNGFVMEEENLILNFSASYLDITPMEETLMRAAMVNTFTQINGISTVEIRVEGQPLTRHDGTYVGLMKASDFSDVLGNGLNAYTRTSVNVYFANETGEFLKKSTLDIAYDNSNAPEQYVTSLILAGPSDEAYGYAVFPADTKMVSVVTKDNICHVDLSGSFVNSTNSPVLPEVTIYALVNSLTELPGIASVQITINGSAAVQYMDQIDLSQPLKRNLDLVEVAE